MIHATIHPKKTRRARNSRFSQRNWWSSSNCSVVKPDQGPWSHCDCRIHRRRDSVEHPTFSAI